MADVVVIREPQSPITVVTATQVVSPAPVSNETVVGAPGPQGPPGPAGADGAPGAPGGTRYEHIQAVAASQWTMVHNLGYKPHVTLIGVDGTAFLGRVEHPDDNTALAVFNQPFAGKAELS